MNFGEILSDLLINTQRLFRKELIIDEITHTQILALISIPVDGIEMSSLAKKLGLDNSTITRLIIRLEKKGFVNREKNKKDQRSFIVFLSKEGIVIQEKIDFEIEILGEKIKAKINEDERLQLSQSLSSLKWIITKTFLKNKEK